MRLLLAVLLTSCSTVPAPADCVSPCGMRLAEQVPGWGCATFDAAEGRALRLLYDYTLTAQEPDRRLYHACERLSGVVVELKPSSVWVSDYDKTTLVAGQTWCDRTPRLIQIAGTVRPEQTSLLHEMAHMVQECTASVFYDPGEDLGHANWQRSGIRAAEAVWRQ